jgi:hypothetical protein
LEQKKFYFNPLFFRRVMKCIKDHKCSRCGELIKKGSSYFYSLDPDPVTGYFIKVCVKCFDERLERHTPLTTEKGLDR